jgi:5-methylcytosine-specific restriction enzyme subunit McrC
MSNTHTIKILEHTTIILTTLPKYIPSNHKLSSKSITLPQWFGDHLKSLKKESAAITTDEEELDDPSDQYIFSKSDGPNTIKVKDYVGSIFHKKDGVSIHLIILPKIAKDQSDFDIETLQKKMNMMFNYANPLISTSEFAPLTSDQNTSPFEFIIRLFAQKLLLTLQRNFVSLYKTVEEARNNIKGKILHPKNIRLQFSHPSKIYCRYDTFDVDHKLHQLFKSTCAFLLKNDYNTSTLNPLRHIVFMLSDISDMPLSLSLCDHIQFDRKTEVFKPFVSFCKMIINQNTSYQNTGNSQSFTFLLNMNVVFEKFIAECYRKAIDPKDQIYYQGSGLIRHQKLFVQDCLLKPDILIKKNTNSETETIIIDTKWKLIDKNPSRADLYQMYAYTKEYKTNKTILLYPKVNQNEKEQIYELNDEKSSVCVKFVDLFMDFHTSEDNFNQFIDHLRKIIGLQPNSQSISSLSNTQKILPSPTESPSQSLVESKSLA